jgi:hypothetical protein
LIHPALIAIASCGALLLSALPAQSAEPAPSFLNDVMPVFTRFGCNQGSCHGKGAGQNGFRLSLRGYAPELDYAWLTREYVGRRISTAAPEESLLLRKPAGLAIHEGGRLFRCRQSGLQGSARLGPCRHARSAKERPRRHEARSHSGAAHLQAR